MLAVMVFFIMGFSLTGAFVVLALALADGIFMVGIL